MDGWPSACRVGCDRRHIGSAIGRHSVAKLLNCVPTYAVRATSRSFVTASAGRRSLGPRAVLGGLLVLGAMYLTELGPRSGEPGDDLGSAEDIGGVLHVGPV